MSTKVYGLPRAVKRKLDAQIRSSSYGRLAETVALLKKWGHPISMSTLHRYCRELQAKDAEAMAREEQAVADAVEREERAAAASAGTLTQVVGELRAIRSLVAGLVGNTSEHASANAQTEQEPR